MSHGLYDVSKIAGFCIHYASSRGEGISNLKLQKILYYIQAAFLVQKGLPCFSEQILKWQYGPVVKSVYESYKQFGSADFCYPAENLDQYQREYLSDIAPDDIAILERVCREKMPYHAFDLVNQTHAEAPWVDTEDYEEITRDSIRMYFSKELQS